MSTLRVNTIQDTAGSGSPAINGLARAWVNFNGTGTVAINASLNVTSITDNGTGDYTINFTTAMSSSSYSLVMSMSEAAARLLWTQGFTTTTARIICANTAQTLTDGIISASVFR